METEPTVNALNQSLASLKTFKVNAADQIYTVTHFHFLLWDSIPRPEKRTFTMESGNLEFGEIELIEDTSQSLPNCVENEDNHTNQFSSSIYIQPEIMLSNKVGDPDMIQDNVVQHLLYRVEKEESHMNQSSPSIYMAPRTLRDLNPSSFNPLVVSIGPLHREDKNVQEFERKKASYLITLMSRIDSPREEILKSWVQKVYNSMEQIKACYVWTKTYSDAEIADMMIMDVCFILEFMLERRNADELLCKEGILLSHNIAHDLVLLGNQIPFFILYEIYQCIPLEFKPSLFELIQPILKYFKLFKEGIKIDNITVNNTHHILSLLHQCYKPPDHIEKGNLSFTIPSASNLDKAGVNFKPSKDPTWLMGMELELSSMFPCIFGFWSKPTLRIPVLVIDYSTEFVLRNLIAYEQAGTTHSYVTSYAVAMDMLVDTQDDIAKLVDSGVLINTIGSNDEAANVINNISKDTAFGGFFYKEQWVKLRKHCDGYWPKNIAYMRRTYFSSPWSMIALLAGIILFALTIVQTIFAIKSTSSNK